ncbi:MAG TPA: universal stress protein [Chromatiaceae bacterium]|nr:universal stress protein [Chromatiaceae bacterium]
MKIRKLLCASHDTAGARAAEAEAFALCDTGASLHHLVVVPDFWKGMMGDDWLNNAATQIRFGSYVENQLEQEIITHVERVANVASQRQTPYSHAILQGKPAECLIAASREDDYDLVVIGSPRPKGVEGYRSRMDLEQLARGLRLPLLIVPHPAA